ncbi:MAG: hypothetical protein II840_05810 [Kiritimatiellae bacterium]|nr:hypothetical protein [Kiritimatiellia bacterium]
MSATVASATAATPTAASPIYLNGVKLEKLFVCHAQILSGGTLEFR